MLSEEEEKGQNEETDNASTATQLVIASGQTLLPIRMPSNWRKSTGCGKADKSSNQ